MVGQFINWLKFETRPSSLRNIRPWTLSVPRSEQFSESLARGKQFVSRNR